MFNHSPGSAAAASLTQYCGHVLQNLQYVLLRTRVFQKGTLLLLFVSFPLVAVDVVTPVKDDSFGECEDVSGTHALLEHVVHLNIVWDVRLDNVQKRSDENPDSGALGSLGPKTVQSHCRSGAMMASFIKLLTHGEKNLQTK